VVSHMDMGAGIAARKRAKSRAVTVAIEHLVFIKPVAVGDIVCVYADLMKVGRTSLKFHMEAWTVSFLKEDLFQKSAEGFFTFVAIDENGKPRPVD
jgi:acyl-CoA thioesterase YciA